MAKGDLKVNRLGPRTKGLGGRKPFMVEAVFGSDEDIEARGRDTDLAGSNAFSPTTSPTNFRSIKPEVGTAKSVNRAPLQYRSQSGRYNEDRGGPGRP